VASETSMLWASRRTVCVPTRNPVPWAVSGTTTVCSCAQAIPASPVAVSSPRTVTVTPSAQLLHLTSSVTLPWVAVEKTTSPVTVMEGVTTGGCGSLSGRTTTTSCST
jgi:hypothetical protein